LIAFLLDTSILVRLANATDVQQPVATRAVLELHRRGEVLHVTPQVLIEFRNVATRPKSAIGAGLPVADAETHAGIFEAQFPLLTETPDIYPTWKTLVEALGVIGKQVHDARLVAVCHVHAVTHLLTLT
jgi:predicted nucleic acid-binding protein